MCCDVFWHILYVYMYYRMSTSTPCHRGFTDSLAGIVKRSLSSIVLDIGITVSFIHQTSDYIEMSFPGVKNIITCTLFSILLRMCDQRSMEMFYCVTRVQFFWCFATEKYIHHVHFIHVSCLVTSNNMIIYR